MRVKLENVASNSDTHHQLLCIDIEIDELYVYTTG
jgi:hypothetical protein